MAKNIGFRPMFLSHDCIFPQHLIKTINKTDLSVELTNGSRIVFSGTEALDRLRGITADLLILDEYAFMSDEVLTVLEPIISARNGRIVVASTPKGYNHFYNLLQKGTLGSPFFTPGYRSWIIPITDERVVIPNKEMRINNAKSTLSRFAYEQEYLVSFNSLQGAVYPTYDITLNNTTKTLDPKLPLFIGGDYNVSRMCFVVGQRYKIEQKDDHGNVIKTTEHLHIIEEVVLDNTNTQAMANELKRRYWSQWANRIFIYSDASGSARKTSAANNTDHSILTNSGFKLIHPRKNPEISDRVNAVNSRFCNASDERFLFVGNQCKHLIHSLTSQAYKNGKPEKGSGLEDLSGPVDALGYIVSGLYPINNNTSNIQYGFGR